MKKILISRADGIFEIAARTFNSLWEKITGKALEIVTEPDGTSDLIVIGTDADNVFLHQWIMDRVVPDLSIPLSSDGYRILSAQVHGRKALILAGGSKAAFLYAVYDYFERAGNCAYFWDGDRIPERKTALPLTGFDVCESPRFRYRGLRYFAHRSLTRFQAEHWNFEDWKKELDFCLKKRFNFFMLRTGIDDLFQKAFPDIVPYPDPSKKLPETVDRSYDDRSLFRSLQAGGELRKKVLTYARERGLISPEDCGTMTHWYSRTPEAFLKKVKPDFLPQASTSYGEKTGLVWDVRQDKYLDLYWHLTETHIREYGSPQIFHTIGLAERGCYADPKKNHEMKLYVYRRIQSKLREKYPDAPLLIGTWDFIERWTPQQVQALLKELNGENTILFDYISDTCDNTGNFTNWGVMHKFPYFFGIFHAYEASTDIRGNYNVIERRLPLAAADPMCKGMVLWPENSHADTLMLEYLSANAWDPSPENIFIESFLEKFLAKRYQEVPQGPAIANVWRRMLPLIRTHYWRTRADERWREIYPDLIFNPIRWHMLFRSRAEELENFDYLANEMRPFIRRAADCFRSLADLDLKKLDALSLRDVFDLARTAALRILNFGIFRTQCRMEDYRNTLEQSIGKELLANLRTIGRMMELLADLLAAHEDYSLYEALLRLKPVNPDFEHTLKGNAENWYCRSFICELFRACYIPEYREIEKSVKKWISAHNSSMPLQPEELMKTVLPRIQDRFYKTPLVKFAPDREKAFKALPDTLKAMAEESLILLKDIKD